MTDKPAALHDALACLAAIGEESRLRLYALLAEAELAVSELVTILGQSQPRVSRHLKLLLEARLVERRREGAWAFFHAPEKGAPAAMAQAVLARLDHDEKRLPPIARASARSGLPAPRRRRNISPNTRRSGTRRGGCTPRRRRSRRRFWPRRWIMRRAGAAARHRLRGRAHAGAARAARRQRLGR